MKKADWEVEDDRNQSHYEKFDGKDFKEFVDAAEAERKKGCGLLILLPIAFVILQVISAM